MRLAIVVSILLAVGMAALFKLATYNPNANEKMADLSQLHTWEPTTEQIRAQLDRSQSTYQQKQHYSKLFRRRYRQKNMPVNLRVDKDGRFYLECAATIPTWDKALIAQQAWHEIQKLFAEKPEVRIYESYIGVPSRWVGTVRPANKEASAPEAVFDTGWHLRRKPQALDFLLSPSTGT